VTVPHVDARLRQLADIDFAAEPVRPLA
jgi:hypothetical protein